MSSEATMSVGGLGLVILISNEEPHIVQVP